MMQLKNLLIAVLTSGFFFWGCATPDNLSDIDSSLGKGKGFPHGKKASPPQKKSGALNTKCFYGCIKKGVSPAKCKHYCSQKPKKGSSKKCSSHKNCYYGCIKKGLSPAKCKHYCLKKSKKVKPGCKMSGSCKVCWDSSGKIVKKFCPKAKILKPGCKEYKGCKLCWDRSGKIVKKFCPKAKKVRPGCKEYKGCKLCWDSSGKIVKKYCPKKPTCKEFKTNDGKLCKVCSDGKKYCQTPKVTCKEYQGCKICSNGKKYCP